eukprot:Hpha_TRINITY_DN30373_c0_g1::TRINITY_DN30373_c0_g1_i1::g.146923::m.146923
MAADEWVAEGGAVRMSALDLVYTLWSLSFMHAQGHRVVHRPTWRVCEDEMSPRLHTLSGTHAAKLSCALKRASREHGCLAHALTQWFARVGLDELTTGATVALCAGARDLTTLQSVCEEVSRRGVRCFPAQHLSSLAVQLVASQVSQHLNDEVMTPLLRLFAKEAYDRGEREWEGADGA